MVLNTLTDECLYVTLRVRTIAMAIKSTLKVADCLYHR